MISQVEAEEKANALANALNTVCGDGWRARVKFSTVHGYNWKAEHPSGVTVLEVFVRGERRYLAYFEPNSRSVGEGMTPLSSLSDLAAFWRAKIDEMERELRMIESAFAGNQRS